MSDNNYAFIAKLESIVQDRLTNPTDNSYTAKLVAAGLKRIAQKIGEEGVEVALAAVSGDRDELVSESADLLYHLIVLLAHQGLSLEDIAVYLESRHFESRH